MKIDKLILCICGLLLSIHLNAQKPPQYVTLKGQLKNFSNQVEVEDMSEFQYLLPSVADRLIVPEENGNFSIRFKLTAPNYFRLGRNALYLSPGDELTVFIDKNNPTLATFEGKGAVINTYLRHTPFPKGGSFLEAGRNLKDTPEETIEVLQELANKRLAEIAQLKGVPNEWVHLEKARIKADLINSLQSGISYSRYKFKNDQEKAAKFLADYKLAIAPLVKEQQKDFVQPDLLKLVVYRDIAESIIEDHQNSKGIKAIKDYFLAYELVRQLQKENDKTILKTYVKRIDSIQTPAYKHAVNRTLDQLLKFGKGDLAKDFTAIDTQGKPINLSSLRGKVIYVDLWATWCGPCMVEMPHFEALKVKYADNPNVAFVSLSIDDTDIVWKKSLAERKAGGHQWLINRNKLNDYNIVGIPRILLIDKEFKVADMNAPSPSSPKAIAAINQLLTK